MLADSAALENRPPRRKGRTTDLSETVRTVNPWVIGGTAQNKRLDRISPTNVHPPLALGVVYPPVL